MISSKYHPVGVMRLLLHLARLFSKPKNSHPANAPASETVCNGSHMRMRGGESFGSQARNGAGVRAEEERTKMPGRTRMVSEEGFE